ncbi:hypothetical protein ACE103_35665 [Bradyrhizobium sp. ma5]|uniref:hypothetical protein n=1 Tax=Bradyrhizobium sp. ma5 TaxID=3344828 RepID=UPI0035D43981
MAGLETSRAARSFYMTIIIYCLDGPGVKVAACAFAMADASRCHRHEPQPHARTPVIRKRDAGLLAT